MILHQKNNRRIFLKSAGATLALPFLASAAGKVKAAGQAPIRFVTIISLHGIPYSTRSRDFIDETKPGKLGTLLPILTPFEKHRDNLIVLSGIDDKSGGGGAHETACCHVLTGRNHIPGTLKASGQSIDSYLSKKIGSNTAFPFLNLLVGYGWDASTFSWEANGIPSTQISNPRNIYNHLFSNFNPSSTIPSADALNRRSVIDYIKNDLTKVSSTISYSDRARLEQHITSIRELENRIGLTNSCAKPIGQWSDISTKDRLPQTLALAAHALACDLSRVVTINVGNVQSGEKYSWVGDDMASNMEHHSISHEVGFRPSNDPRTIDEFRRQSHNAMTKIRAWHGEQITVFMDQLANSIDIDGSRVLDNTVIFWTTEVADGNSHSPRNFPYVLLAGKNTGLIQGGHHFNFQGRAHNDVLTTILKATGQPDLKFGQDDLNQGPLTQLFI